MTHLNKILTTLAGVFLLLGVFVLLGVIGGSGYRYLQYQLERTPADPQQLAEFYVRPAALPDFATAAPQPCSNGEMPKAILERAWTSPIWVMPSAS